MGLLLRSVHRSPSTRSQLTRSIGLNRSTVAALVAELEESQLVVEAKSATGGQPGRPSHLVRPSDVPIAFCINPDRDAITFGVVQLGGRVLTRTRIPLDRAPTPGSVVTETVAAMAEIIPRLPTAHRVVGVGVAVPGIVRRSDSTVRLAPNLGWQDVPFAAMLGDAIGLPVSVANDGTLGARGEWLFGAGHGAENLVYMHGGDSGVGGGIVSGGVLLEGESGHAGEFGHSIVRRGGARDNVGAAGTLESEVQRERLVALLGDSNIGPEDFEQHLRESRSDQVRHEVLRQLDVLAVAISNALVILNPSRIILGGYLGALTDLAPGYLVSRVFERALPAVGEAPDIRRAKLGDDLMLIGAAELAFAPLLTDPLGS